MGTRRPSPTPRSSSRPPASSCRTSPACPASSTSPPCARPSSALGGDPNKINPLAPAELVIDHSVIADLFGTENALERNVEIEYERNGERYQFLRWGQTAFDDFKVVPPGTGIVHQVNIEYLARVTFTRDGRRRRCAPTPTPASAPTRTPRWSTASACSAGASAASRPRRRCSASPSRCSSRKVVGFKLTGAIPTGVTATDVVLTITQMLRKHGVVGKFVEFYGEGVAEVPLANRATIGNMSPEFGSTAAMFPIDDVTLDYLRLTGRSDEQVALVEAYSKLQKLWHDPAVEPVFSEYLELDLATVVPSIAGPKRPQDRVELSKAKTQFELDLDDYAAGHDMSKVDAAVEGTFPASDPIGFTAAGRGDGARAARTRTSATRPATCSQPVEGHDRATARSTRSTTAPSRSRRSPRARTPRTRASCSRPACWRATRSRRA